MSGCRHIGGDAVTIDKQRGGPRSRAWVSVEERAARHRRSAAALGQARPIISTVTASRGGRRQWWSRRGPRRIVTRPQAPFAGIVEGGTYHLLQILRSPREKRRILDAIGEDIEAPGRGILRKRGDIGDHRAERRCGHRPAKR